MSTSITNKNKAPSTSKLSDKKRTLLIAAVRCYDCLWNKESEFYRDKQRKSRIWMQIGEKLEIDNPYQAFRCLRIQYNENRAKRLKAQKRIGAAAGEKPVKWQFFEELRFLDEPNGRKALDAINPSDQSFVTPDVDDKLCVFETGSQKSGFVNKNEDYNDQFEAYRSLVTPTTTPTSQAGPREPTLSALLPSKTNKEKFCDRESALLSTFEATSGRDENDIFGIFIATSVRKLPEPVKMQAKHEILKILMNAEIVAFENYQEGELLENL